MVNPTPVPSNVPRQQNIAATNSPTSTTPVPTNGGVRIKSEPGVYNGQSIAPYGNTIARQRAAQNLQNKFGSSANLQVNQLQAAAMGNVAPSSQSPPFVPNIQLPAPYSEQQKKELQDPKRQAQQRPYPTLNQAPQRPAIKGSQLDGADEWAAMVAHRRAYAISNPTATDEANQTLREQVDQMSLAMEGGGLMLPLSEQPKRSLTGKYGAGPPAIKAGFSSSLGLAHGSAASSQIAQYDGLKESDEDPIKGDPDLEDDADAINSDLDDPEENVVEEEGDDEGKTGQIMLCTYDKVQRVKNKWKCTLKDGVLTTGGRE